MLKSHNRVIKSTSNFALLWLLVYVAFLGYLFFLLPFSLYSTPDEQFRILDGERINGLFNSIPDDFTDNWKPVSLPDDWRLAPINETDAWYRFELPDYNSDQNSIALYLPTVRQNVAVFVNDKWVGQGGHFSGAGTHLWNHPLLFEFSSALLKQENNTLHIRLATHREASGYLSPIYLGPHDALQTAWKWRHFVKVDLFSFISHLMFIIACINIVLWGLRRQDTYYLWYALVCFLWGLRGYLLLTPELPISDELWVGLRLITLGVGIACVMLFIQRFFAYQNRALDWVLAIYCIPLALPLLFLGTEDLHFYGHKIWMRGGLLIAAYVTFRLYNFYRSGKHKKALVLLYAGLPLFIIGLRDILILNDKWDPQNGFLFNYASLPTLLLAMWFILQRFARSLSTAEELNVSLDRRVKEREKKLQIHFKQREKMHEKQLLNEERERIMRDMHDGLGGHLVGLKSLTESKTPNLKKVKTQVDRALIDLRLVINSLDVTSQNLSTLLGSMRTRWQRLSKAQNIELIWQVTSGIDQNKLGPNRTLQIMRILEEAFTNCLKHSNANEITVSSGLDHQILWVTIQDNGHNGSLQNTGHGLENMRHRANSIDAKIEISSSPNGCLVKLRLSI